MIATDAVMLSYDEPLAGELHVRLERVLRRPTKRLHGVRGMHRAYRLTAELVDYELYFLADGDFAISEDFDPTAVAPLAPDVSMRVWPALNPLNGLVYGYGGLKLMRRSDVFQLGSAVDVLAALPGRVEFSKDIAGTTRCNQSPYHAWKAAFRECAMLSQGSEYGMSKEGTRNRLAAWKSCGQGEFAEFAVAGAHEGIAFAAGRGDHPDDLDKINDPGWLLARFTATHSPEGMTA
ncbi:hypothetical protein [Streptomyces sp. NBC_01207]|uniref:hypothetical protein n=1 Tax=Streptomyces sp. NBC_01207 TaxID=2903772 RepID=UPI002E0DC9D3|nr:hypothetical protein OG457_38850 [Streptomyces sp. NBC_01207]